MATTPHESKTLEDVRRWRKEAYEEWAKMTHEERVRYERELVERLGLSHLPVAETLEPGTDRETRKKAG